MPIERAARHILALALALAVNACALLVSFDDYEANPTLVDRRPAPTGDAIFHGVSGSVDGLDGAKIVLRLGALEREVGDGPFSLPTSVQEGATYAIVVGREVDGHDCFIEHGSGTMGTADVSGVAVHCPATEAALADLTLSVARLAPTFNPALTEYDLHFDPLVSAPTTTVTATTKSARATLTIAGTPSLSGKPSARLALLTGPNEIEVVVTAADGHTKKSYSVTLTLGAPAYRSPTYVKADSTIGGMHFGQALAASGDTLVIGAPDEPSGGAVYVFVKRAGVWSQRALLRASNPRADARFGASVSIEGDTLVVGAPGESSSATGINGDQSSTAAPGAGAVYVFTDTADVWKQTAYLKPSNTHAGQSFGAALALSGDALAVGSPKEACGALGVGAAQCTTPSAAEFGAVYVFRRGGAWAQEAYLKEDHSDGLAHFGGALAFAGTTLVVGAPGERSDVSSYGSAGGVHVFSRAATTWSQEAYLNDTSYPYFGTMLGASLALSQGRLAVGAPGDSGVGAGVNGSRIPDPSASGSGAVVIFERFPVVWTRRAFLKASNSRAGARFGTSLAFAGDELFVGAPLESSAAVGGGGAETDASAPGAGAVYGFRVAGGTWTQTIYLKASNTRSNARFGGALAIGAAHLAVGSDGESSKAIGIDGDAADTSAPNAGAVYVH